MRRWHTWLCALKKEDEEKKVEVEHQQVVSRKIRSVEGGTSLLHTITEPTAERGGVQILKEEEKKMPSFWSDVRRRETNGQCIGSATRRCNKNGGQTVEERRDEQI